MSDSQKLSETPDDEITKLWDGVDLTGLPVEQATRLGRATGEAILAAETRAYRRAVEDVRHRLFGGAEDGPVPPNTEVPAGELVRLLDELWEAAGA